MKADRLRTVDAMSKELEGMTREEFLAAYTAPFLIVGALSLLESSGRHTLKSKREATGDELVVPVTKASGANSFPSFVTIGRSSTNDIVLPDEGVSKHHAYIILPLRPGAPYVLVDAGSSNGTYVLGRKVEAKAEKTVLHSGIEVRFGELSAIFYDPADVWSFFRGRFPASRS
jgi:hypothetical protein